MGVLRFASTFYRAACLCGWLGDDRDTHENASADLEEHQDTHLTMLDSFTRRANMQTGEELKQLRTAVKQEINTVYSLVREIRERRRRIVRQDGGALERLLSDLSHVQPALDESCACCYGADHEGPCCPGWFLNAETHEVERCDECKLFESDKDAQAEAAAAK
jgi:hypothetical protein